MIVEIAIADAYGCGFEFAKQEIIEEHNNLNYFIKHPKDDICGQYTDDTQMSIALVEHILGYKPRNKLAIANSFVETFMRDPRKGYARRFQELLESLTCGQELLDKIEPISIRNGAMMRSVPLCLIPNEDEMLKFAETQASITHDNHWGITSSKIIGYLAYHTLRGKSLRDIICEIEYKFNFTPNLSWTGRVPCDAEATLHAVFAVLDASESYGDALLRSVYLGGDTDSVAAIAAGIISLSDYPITSYNSLDNLYDNLENGEYGRDYLESLDSTISKQINILKRSR